MEEHVESVLRPIRSAFLVCLRAFWYCFREPKSFRQKEKDNYDRSTTLLLNDGPDYRTPAPPKGPLIAFSYAGMLWAYYLGVIGCLRDHFDIHASNVCFSGISAGTSAVLTMFLDLSIEQGFDCGLGWQQLFDNRPLKYWFISTSEILQMIMKKFTSFGIDNDVLHGQYKKFGGSDAIHFGVTALKWKWRRFWRMNTFHVLLNDFKSLKQMCYAGLCSTRTIPFFRTLGFYGDHYVMDGALTSNYSIPANYVKYQSDGEGSEDKVIRIAVLNHKSIPATIKPVDNFHWNEWITSGDLEDNLMRFNKGYRDAARLGTLAECIKKGLIWSYETDFGTALDEGKTAEWNVHVDERVKEWNKRIRKYFEITSDTT